MAKSKFTKNAITKLWIYRAIDAIVLLVPLLVYVIMGLASGGVVEEKVALVGSVSIALILTIFNVITKKHLRSPIWIVILGLYVATDKLMPLIICLAIGSILDEFVLSPLIEKAKVEVISNKTIDKRS